jgi:signal transduction histidine kinase
VRRTLALVCAAVTSMVALAFLIPLALLVRQIARDHAFSSAQLQAAAIEPVLAVTTSRPGLTQAVGAAQAGGDGRLAVYLTDPAGGKSVLAAGDGPADPADLARAVATARSFTVARPGGYVMFQPVALADGRLAVIEVFLPGADLTRGVAVSWAAMTGVAVLLVAVSVVLADRLAAQVTRPARRLATAAAALGDGDLGARSEPSGPPELTAAAAAFNTMAERLSRMITAERVMAADLPHRLRTPLTALRMNAAALGPGRAEDETRLAVTQMEQEVDKIIRAARRPALGEPSSCDAAEVLAERMDFWSALADDQFREWHLVGADAPVPVPVPRPDLIAAADALLGNIFLHTGEGTGFAVTLHAGDGVVAIFFADAGPGIADPDAALQRGRSGRGSTGLGLDIARRVAESTGGELRIDRSALGGAQVQLWLRTGGPPSGRARRANGRRRLSRRSARP